MNLTLYYAAMWVSEIFYARYDRLGCIYSRTRSIVTHDRILNGRISTTPKEST